MKRKSKILIMLIMLASTVLISIFAFVPIERKYDESSINWMSKLSDDTNVLDLSLPGTHDSGALHSIADVAGKCQDISISSQLEIGVRFFDLRLQLVNNELKIVHSFVDQNLKFAPVVEDLYSFIKEYDSEFLIISIKEDNDSVSSTISFEEALIKALTPYDDVYRLNDSKLPKTVGMARSKIFILSRFDGEIGIPAYNGWDDDECFELNDLYAASSFENKSSHVKSSAFVFVLASVLNVST
jgi:1-phosphatidylinositol phosphodiesterase